MSSGSTCVNRFIGSEIKKAMKSNSGCVVATRSAVIQTWYIWSGGGGRGGAGATVILSLIHI